MVLAENLVMLRNVKGMTQEQVAEVIGISRQSYAKWEQERQCLILKNATGLPLFMELR
ncbi:MAG: helix-turn-helix transcriptional regulator [Lachnospiraceae bacterium]|nr:helix-turn-helix transcriptional regulator [Lachnospiraceae bacterium]